MTYTGQVVKERVAAGSKSDRAAVMLDTGEARYVLRRRGGNAFADPALDELVGRRLRFEGLVHGYTLIVSDWHDAPTK